MAAKIPVSSLIQDFQLMLREHWVYGAETKRGQVDCSGAFEWAYRQHGLSIYHGSNRIARTEVEALIPIGQAAIVPGMAAFKLRAPGASKYALPDSYRLNGSQYNGDLNDYYHIGLVDADTSRVLNAQSAAAGFVASPITQNWSHVAYLKQVDYSGQSQPGLVVDDLSDDSAIVVAASGSSVKMCATPSTAENLYWDVPLGSTVTLRGAASNGWTPIAWGGKKGYMMDQFLVRSGDQQDETWQVIVMGLNYSDALALQRQYPGASIQKERSKEGDP